MRSVDIARKKIATLGLGVILTSNIWAKGTASVSVCIEPEPPPWAFWERDISGTKTEKLTGFSVDLIRRTFARIDRSVEFKTEFPWARCLYLVKLGKIDFAMNAFADPERERIFAFSRHYNTLTPQVFYLASNPVRINSTADLKHYRGCGLLGASYESYGVANQDLDLASGFHSLSIKLLNRRCDYF